MQKIILLISLILGFGLQWSPAQTIVQTIEQKFVQTGVKIVEEPLKEAMTVGGETFSLASYSLSTREIFLYPEIKLTDFQKRLAILHEKIHAIIDFFYGTNLQKGTFEEACIRLIIEELLIFYATSAIDISENHGGIDQYMTQKWKRTLTKEDVQRTYFKAIVKGFFTTEVITGYVASVYLMRKENTPFVSEKCLNTEELIKIFPREFNLRWNNLSNINDTNFINPIPKEMEEALITEIKKMIRRMKFKLNGELITWNIAKNL